KGVLKGHTDCVCSVSFDQKGDFVVSGSFDKTARVWNMKELQEDFMLKHDGAVLSVIVGTIIDPVAITGCVDGLVRAVGKKGNSESHRHRSWVNSLAMYDIRDFASGSSDGTVRLI